MSAAPQSRSWSWRKAILTSDLPGDCRHVLLTLSCYMNEMGESCFPSIERLTEDCGKARSTVMKYLSLACEKGWLEKREMKLTRPGADNRGWRRNEYIACWPESDLASEPAEFSPSKTAESTAESDVKPEKGGPSDGPRSKKGGPSGEEGGPSDGKKVVRLTDPNSPVNHSRNPSTARAREAPPAGGAGVAGDSPEGGSTGGGAPSADEPAAALGTLDAEREKRLLAAWHCWDGRLAGSKAGLLKEAAKLTPAEFTRATDTARIAAWREAERAGKLPRLRLFVAYLRDRKFDAEPVAALLACKATPPLRLEPFGKAWMARRLWLLGFGPRGAFRPTAFQQRMIEAGKSHVIEADRRRAVHAAAVALDSAAMAGEAPVLAAPGEVTGGQFGEYVAVARETPEWRAWAAWHAERGYPWIDPPAHIRFIWLPQRWPEGFEIVVADRQADRQPAGQAGAGG